MNQISTSTNHFWDSCVLISYIQQSQPDFGVDMHRILEETRGGVRKVWISTLFYAEMRPSLLSGTQFSSIDDLIDDFEGVLFPISANPDILMRAARLRDREFWKEKPQKDEKARFMSVPDAIQIASGLFVKEALGISDIEFHTFDDGKGKKFEERGVSLLRLEEYCTHHMHDPDIQAACALPRMRPALRQPALNLG